MCLFTRNKEGYVSNEPKTCYKVYLRGDDGKLISYYVGTRYDLKEEDEIVAEGKGDIERYGLMTNTWTLGVGFIHAVERKCYMLFVSLIVRMNSEFISARVTNSSRINMAEIDEALDIIKKELDSLCLCEMEIPIGERYWRDDICSNSKRRTLCARKMVFKGEIKLEKKSDILQMVYELCYTKRENPEVRNKWESLIETYKDMEEEEVCAW